MRMDWKRLNVLAVVDVLRRSGVEVTLVSVTGDRKVTGSHGIELGTDALFEDVNPDVADVLFLPGGMPGTNNLKAHMGLRAAVECANKQGRRIAAICAAPSILGSMGLLKGRTATCYPGFEDQLTGVSYTSQGVVTDGNITTGRGLGFALDMGLELIRLLQGPQQAQRQSSITGNSIRMRKTPVLFYIIWMWDGMEVFFVKNAGVFKMSML